MALTIKGTPQPISEMTAALQDISKDALLALAKANTDVLKFTDGKPVVKEIVVPGKLVNIVAT